MPWNSEKSLTKGEKREEVVKILLRN
jgi:hypothetical protein